MKLIDYLEKIGDEAAAERFGVSKRTAQSWRLGERTPRKEHAAVIVQKSPVTYAGIYGLPETARA